MLVTLKPAARAYLVSYKAALWLSSFKLMCSWSLFMQVDMVSADSSLVA